MKLFNKIIIMSLLFLITWHLNAQEDVNVYRGQPSTITIKTKGIHMFHPAVIDLDNFIVIRQIAKHDNSGDTKLYVEHYNRQAEKLNSREIPMCEDEDKCYSYYRYIQMNGNIYLVLFKKSIAQWRYEVYLRQLDLNTLELMEEEIHLGAHNKTNDIPVAYSENSEYVAFSVHGHVMSPSAKKRPNLIKVFNKELELVVAHEIHDRKIRPLGYDLTVDNLGTVYSLDWSNLQYNHSYHDNGSKFYDVPEKPLICRAYQADGTQTSINLIDKRRVLMHDSYKLMGRKDGGLTAVGIFPAPKDDPCECGAFWEEYDADLYLVDSHDLREKRSAR